MKAIVLALAAAFTAAADSLTATAEGMEDTGLEAPAPAPRKPAAAGKAAATPAKPKPRSKLKQAETASIETVREKMIAYIKSDGRDKGVALLGRFGVEKLGELAEEQIEEFNTTLDQCIAGELDPEAVEEGTDDMLG